MRASLLALTALCGLASAHFQLKYPPTIGFDDDKEGTGPCGGFTPDLSKSDLPEFHVDGDAVALRLAHPQCKWLFRVTTDPSNDTAWEQIYPIVLQSGLGDFCLPQITVPEKYAGKKGVLSIVSSAVDGMLYQCAALNFVKGTQKAPSQCTNATIKADFTSDPGLQALVGSGGSGSGSGSSTSAPSGSSTQSSTSSASSPTSSDSKKNGAGTLRAGERIAVVLGSVAIGGLFMM